MSSGIHPKFISVYSPASAELVIRKSRFITDVFPVSQDEQIQIALRAVRECHPNATHICYAYKCGLDSEIIRFSDAGEPSGTAGRPILEVIERAELRNTLVVVTRYFGGILLGAAGLVRAYAGAAAAGIEAAGKHEYAWHITYRVTVNYVAWGRVERILRDQGLQILHPEYSADVSFTCRVLVDHINEWITLMQDLTGGQILLESVGEGYFPIE